MEHGRLAELGQRHLWGHFSVLNNDVDGMHIIERGDGCYVWDDQGNRYPIVYEIDEFRCIFCGMCQEVCPVEAIHVGQHFENAEYTRGRFVYDLDRLMEQDHPTTLLWDPSDPSSE